MLTFKNGNLRKNGMLAAIAVVEQLPAPQRITEEEARAIAAAEGLVLVPAPSSSTGYKGVTRSGSGGKPFKAQARQDGVKKNLGNYATAAEASLAYVRHVGPEACAVEAWRATTTAVPAASSEPEQTAQQLAATEGLVLVPAPGTATGYKGVTRSGGSSKPFKAQVRQAGCLGKSVKKNLGCYGTAAEAALAYARHLSATATLPPSCLASLTLHAPPPNPGGHAQGTRAGSIALLEAQAGSALAAAPSAFAPEPLLEAHAEPVPPMLPLMLPPMPPDMSPAAPPMHVEPMHAEPMHAALPHAEPAYAAQLLAAPRMVASLAAPARTEPMHAAASAFAEPAYVEPPSRAESAHVELAQAAAAAALQMTPPLQMVAAALVETSAIQEVLQEAAGPVAEVVLPGMLAGEVLRVEEVTMHAMLDASGRVEGEGMI